MAITRCSLVACQSRVISALNAGTASAYGTTISDQRRASGEIDAAILGADARICRAIAARKGDGYRSLFLDLSSSIGYGGLIPDHIGPVEQVIIRHDSGGTYKPGKTDEFVTLADIENWRTNGAALYGAAHDAAGSVIAGFYKEVGGPKNSSYLYYTGNDAKAYIANITRTGVPQAPEVYEDAVVGLALENLLKEGDRGDVLVQNLIAAARAQLALLEAPTELREAA